MGIPPADQDLGLGYRVLEESRLSPFARFQNGSPDWKNCRIMVKPGGKQENMARISFYLIYQFYCFKAFFVCLFLCTLKDYTKSRYCPLEG